MYRTIDVEVVIILRAKVVVFFFRGRAMSLIKYLNHRQKFFASVLSSILPCAQISGEVRVKLGRGVVVPTDTEEEY